MVEVIKSILAPLVGLGAIAVAALIVAMPALITLVCGARRELVLIVGIGFWPLCMLVFLLGMIGRQIIDG
jgi:hypothetical protein